MFDIGEQSQVTQIPDVKNQVDAILSIKKDLLENTISKFQESFESRDLQGIT